MHPLGITFLSFPIQTKIPFYQLIHLIFIEKRDRSNTKLFVALYYETRDDTKELKVFRFFCTVYCTVHS